LNTAQPTGGSPTGFYAQEDRRMFYLGIDQHRKQLTVALRDEQGNLVFGRQVSNDREPTPGFSLDFA
jgi:hypothetical protein